MDIVCKHKEKKGDGPHDGQPHGCFHDLYVGRVVARIQLEYELVVDPTFTPAPDVDREQKYENDAQSWATVQPGHYWPVTAVLITGTEIENTLDIKLDYPINLDTAILPN